MARNERFDPFDRKNVGGFDGDCGCQIQRVFFVSGGYICNTNVTTEMCEFYVFSCFLQKNVSEGFFFNLKILKAVFSVSVKGKRTRLDL